MPSEGVIRLLPGYTVTEEVYRSRRRVVYRGIRDGDGVRVVLKTLVEGSGGAGALAREFELIRSLELEGVPRAIELVTAGDREILLLEDAGPMRLKAFLPADGLDIGAFLRLATQLAEIVGALHHRKLIHKDINPNNILIDPETGRLALIDFSIASRMPSEHQDPRHPSVLEGTIAYLSPDQTGRMNRDIDIWARGIDRERWQVRIGKVAIVVRIFLAAHRPRLVPVGIEEPGFLHDGAALLDQLDLPAHFELDRLLEEAEAVEVLDLAARSELRRAGPAHRYVRVAAEASFLHVAVADVDPFDERVQCLRVRDCLGGAAHVGLGHDLEKRCAGSVQIDAGHCVQILM